MCLEAFHRRPLHHQFGISFRIAERLRAVGITTMRDLLQIGAIAAYSRLQDSGEKPALSILYALEGAIIGEHWHCFSTEQKAEINARLSGQVTKR